LPFDPQHFLGLAKELLTTKTTFTEANFRCVISRAYYASHLFARETLRRYFPTQLSRVRRQRLGQDHELVPRLLTQKGHFTIATKLDGLRIKRAKVDYDLGRVWDVNPKTDAQNAVMLSDFIIKQIKASPLLKRL